MSIHLKTTERVNCLQFKLLLSEIPKRFYCMQFLDANRREIFLKFSVSESFFQYEAMRILKEVLLFPF